MPTRQTFKDLASRFFTSTFSDFVETYTFVLDGEATYDPITGTYSDAGTNYNIGSIRLNFENRQFDGDRIKIGDIKIITRVDYWEELSIVPEANSGKVFLASEPDQKYQIINVMNDAANAVYEFHLRGL